MMVAYPNTLKESAVMGTLPEHNAQFIEIDADDARYFGYLGPNKIARFFRDSVAPRMEEPTNKERFIEALTTEGWVECVAGMGIPHGSIAMRLYPPAIANFVDMAQFEGPEVMFQHFLDDYMKHLTCP